MLENKVSKPKSTVNSFANITNSWTFFFFLSVFIYKYVEGVKGEEHGK